MDAEAAGGMMSIVSIFVIIAGIMAIFIPFWIFRIRNEVITMNKKLNRMIELLGGEKQVMTETGTIIQGDKYKICPSCGQKNRLNDQICLICKQAI